ncbi:DUF1127 domain-containing protein [Pseudoruegeria sp. HB172150]|uniref:DUF1127 domain-containing protein n=1 Tax=Pseudoruegeria sp. HB172150 TaxID=2721164 RepID=UPI001556FFC6|nr:DUF1127 domain-containing protein [Pseudoruegeria sp. HB172150]
MTQARTNDSLGYLSSRPLTPVATAVIGFVALLVKWDERRRSRKALAELDHFMLFDIGITPEQARREISRPFWRD